MVSIGVSPSARSSHTSRARNWWSGADARVPCVRQWRLTAALSASSSSTNQECVRASCRLRRERTSSSPTRAVPMPSKRERRATWRAIETAGAKLTGGGPAKGAASASRPGAASPSLSLSYRWPWRRRSKPLAEGVRAALSGSPLSRRPPCLRGAGWLRPGESACCVRRRRLRVAGGESPAESPCLREGGLRWRVCGAVRSVDGRNDILGARRKRPAASLGRVGAREQPTVGKGAASGPPVLCSGGGGSPLAAAAGAEGVWQSAARAVLGDPAGRSPVATLPGGAGVAVPRGVGPSPKRSCTARTGGETSPPRELVRTGGSPGAKGGRGAAGEAPPSPRWGIPPVRPAAPDGVAWPSCGHPDR